MLRVQSSWPGTLRLLCRRAIQPFIRPQVRLVRPSVLCPRVDGDAWILAEAPEQFVLRVGDVRLAQFHGLPFDLPSFNQVLDRLRCRPPRRRSRLASTAG